MFLDKKGKSDSREIRIGVIHLELTRRTSNWGTHSHAQKLSRNRGCGSLGNPLKVLFSAEYFLTTLFFVAPANDHMIFRKEVCWSKIRECECLFGLLNLLNLVANRFVCVLTIPDPFAGQHSAKGQKRSYTNHVRALKSSLEEGGGNFENATCSPG